MADREPPHCITPHADAAPDMYEVALPKELRANYRNAPDGPDMGREIRVLRVIITSLLPEIAIASTRVFILRTVIELGKLVASQIRTLGKHSHDEELLQLLADTELTEQEQQEDR